MKKPILLLAVLAAGSASMTMAHPTGIPFESRGACERAYAESSKLDRERIVDVLGLVDNYGEAQRTFNETFRCEYDESAQAWFIVRVG